MTNLVGTASWDNVPELEITDPLQGGHGGPLNLGRQALMNRTEALKWASKFASPLAVGDGYTDDLAAFNAITSKLIALQSPPVSYDLSANWTPAAGDKFITAAPDISFGGHFPDYKNLIPYESVPGPIWSQHIISKTYGSAWAGCGNVFQMASYAKASVSDVPVVALYAEGEAAAAGSNAWGLNTSCFASNATGTAIGYELNTGVLAAGGTAYGLVIASSGPAGYVQNAIQIDANETGSQYLDGIFAHFTETNLRGCIKNAVFRVGGSGSGENCQRFLYASGVTASVAEIDTPSFLVGATPAGVVNRASVSGSATGVNPSIAPVGSDTNIGLSFASKGTGVVTWTTNGTEAFRVRSTGSTDSLQVDSASGAGNLSVRGSSTTSDVNILGKGNGGVLLFDGAGNTKFRINTVGVGFYGATPAAKPTVTGSRGGNVALASLITALASLGLVTDSSTT